MKRRFARFLFGAVFAALSASVVVAQDVPWRLIVFEPGDPATSATINETIRDGYMPVGMETKPGESLSVLFVRSGTRTVDSWAILDYDDWNALEAEITGGIQDGFVPMDISRYSDRLAVLWVRTDVQVEGWRISTSPNTIGDRTRTINEFQSQGFTLWGLSVYEELAWYLFLRTAGDPPAGAVSGYAKDTMLLQSGMAGASSRGWLPNGFASNSSTIYICYVK
jgi:hypothetical protein